MIFTSYLSTVYTAKNTTFFPYISPKIACLLHLHLYQFSTWDGLFSVQHPVAEEPLASRTFSSPFIFEFLSKINCMHLFLDSLSLNRSLSVSLYCLGCCGLQDWVRGSGRLSSVLFQNHFYDSSNFSFHVNFQTRLSITKESCQGLLRISLLSADGFPQRWQAALTFWSTQRYWTMCRPFSSC